jgi:hypothetical protein
VEVVVIVDVVVVVVSKLQYATKLVLLPISLGIWLLQKVLLQQAPWLTTR